MNGQPKPLFYLAVGVVVIALLALGGWQLSRLFSAGGEANQPPVASSSKPGGEPGKTPPVVAGGKKPIDPVIRSQLVPIREIPTLSPPGEYKPQGDVIDCEISEWPGYAPIIVANGGLEPNPDSYFARKHGFKLRIKVSEAEEESWHAINSGKNAISVTTADVLALYANQLKVEVPVQLDFSRGGDGILTLKEITSLNQLKGKVVVTAQFTEAEFFIRFLAQEAGIKVKSLKGPDDVLDPDKINLVFTKKAEEAAAVFVASVKNGDGFLSGAVTWSPFTVEVPQEMPDKVHLLTSNRNLLVVADVVIVNSAFAKNNPKIVKGLVEGILVATEELKKNPDGTLPVVAKAFDKSPQAMKELMGDVHLSNHAENLLFFAPASDKLGNFSEIYTSAVYAYGRDFKAAAAPEKIINRSYLEQLEKDGLFKGQQVTLAPVKREGKQEVLEQNPVFTKQIRFRFEPNSTELDLKDPTNQQALKDLTQLLKLAPGAYFMFRGHLDNSRVEEFKQQGEAFYRRQASRAIADSKKRADSVKDILVKQYSVDPMRLDSEGKGWDDPLPGASHDENRRVEVRFFTLE